MKQLTLHPFVADLPRRMLSASPRGALAVISHIERTWSGTFLQGGFLRPQTDVFESVIYDILRGKPVGAAMEHLNGWRSNLSAHLTPIMEEVAFRNEADAQFFRRLQGAIDAQWYAVVGDPAVHL